MQIYILCCFRNLFSTTSCNTSLLFATLLHHQLQQIFCTMIRRKRTTNRSSVNSFFVILYPFRKILYPKITSNFIAQTHLEIGREFFFIGEHISSLISSCAHRKFLPCWSKLIHPLRKNCLPSITLILFLPWNSIAFTRISLPPRSNFPPTPFTFSTHLRKLSAHLCKLSTPLPKSSFLILTNLHHCS